MSDLDLAAAAEALVRVQYERVWRYLDALDPDAPGTSWDTSPSEVNKAQWLAQARQDVETVAPLIAAQVRAQTAAAIEGAASSAAQDVGQPYGDYDLGLHYAYRRSADIARGES